MLYLNRVVCSIPSSCPYLVAGNLLEEQRALATLGRIYLVQSEESGVGKEEARELRVRAGNANLKSLDICDKLSGVNSDRCSLPRA